MKPAGRMSGFHNAPDHVIRPPRFAGLDGLFSAARRKGVLVAGCGDGTVALELARESNAYVHGVDIDAAAIELADLRLAGRMGKFEVRDLNAWQPDRQYDLVVALGVLPHLRNPSSVLEGLADRCKFMFVVSLPREIAPVIVDATCSAVKHNVASVLRNRNFGLASNDEGPRGEWVGYFIRLY